MTPVYDSQTGTNQTDLVTAAHLISATTSAVKGSVFVQGHPHNLCLELIDDRAGPIRVGCDNTQILSPKKKNTCYITISQSRETY